MTMTDDRTGQPTGIDPWKLLIAAHNDDVRALATQNFVRIAELALDRYTPEHVAFVEEHYTQLFDGILAGCGRWVREVFATARANRGTA